MPRYHIRFNRNTRRLFRELSKALGLRQSSIVTAMFIRSFSEQYPEECSLSDYPEAERNWKAIAKYKNLIE